MKHYNLSKMDEDGNWILTGESIAQDEIDNFIGGSEAFYDEESDTYYFVDSHGNDFMLEGFSPAFH